MKVPMRLCLSCRNMKEKGELIRIVRTPEGSIHIDLRNKMNGRGAYICRNTECFTNACKRHSVERSLGMQIPEEILDNIKEIINEQTR